MGVTNVDPGTLASSWAQNMKAAGTRMTAGVDAVTTPPGQAAAAAADLWLANTQAAQARFKQNSAATPIEKWRGNYKAKGIPRIAAGVDAATSDFAQVLGKILSAQKSIVSSLPARGGLEANIQRSADFQRKMASYKGQFK